MDYDREQLRRELSRDEGRVNHAYRDGIRTETVPRGYLTVGVGWNIDVNGIPPQVAALLDPALGDPRDPDTVWPDAAVAALLDLGIDQAERVLDGLVPGWRGLDAVRQRVLLNMAFNMGHRLAKFPRFLAAVNAGDWAGAAVELDAAHSPEWHRDVGPRADRLMAMIGAGENVADVA